MTAAIIVLTTAAACALLALGVRDRARALAIGRLDAAVDGSAGVDAAPAPKPMPPFPPRYRYAAPILGIATALFLALVVRLPIEIAAAGGILVGVLSHLAEEQLADQRAATIEMQLAEAIDLLVGSLRAGSSLLAAFESALQETKAPLKP